MRGVNIHDTELKLVLNLLSRARRSLTEQKWAMFEIRRQILMVFSWYEKGIHFPAQDSQNVFPYFTPRNDGSCRTCLE
jgi:hypothetical protein